MAIFKNLDWKAVENTLKNGDIAIFDSAERINEPAKEAFETYKRIYKKGISLIFLNDSFLNTSIYKLRVENRPTVKNFGIPEDGKFRMVVDGAEETFKRMSEHCFFMVLECLVDKSTNPQGLMDYYDQTKEDLSKALVAVKEIVQSQRDRVASIDRNNYWDYAASYGPAKDTADDMEALAIIVSLFFHAITSYMESVFMPVMEELQLGKKENKENE